MAQFSGQTGNSSIFYFGPINENYAMYFYIVYSGDTNEINRTATVNCDLYVYYKYDYTFSFGPVGYGGDATIKVGGNDINPGGSYRYQGNGGPYKLTSFTTTLYYNENGGLDKSVYGHLQANHIYHVSTGTYKDIDMTLNDTLWNIPDISPVYTPASIWMDPRNYDKIARLNVGQWGVYYGYDSGTNSNVPITVAIHDYYAQQWGVKWEPVIRYVTGRNEVGVWDTYTLSDANGFTSGNEYRMTLVANHRRMFNTK